MNRKPYNVCMDPAYVRDAQMIDTSGLTDDELENLDFSSEETEDLCHDIEPYSFIGTFIAGTEEEAVRIAAKEKRYDPRVLFAEEVKAACPFRANVVLETKPISGKGHSARHTFTGIVMARDEADAKRRAWVEFPEILAKNPPNIIRSAAYMTVVDVVVASPDIGWFHNLTGHEMFLIL